MSGIRIFGGEVADALGCKVFVLRIRLPNRLNVPEFEIGGDCLHCIDLMENLVESSDRIMGSRNRAVSDSVRDTWRFDQYEKNYRQ